MKDSWKDLEDIWNFEDPGRNNIGKMYEGDRFFLQLLKKRWIFQTGMAAIFLLLVMIVFQWQGPTAVVVQEGVRYVLCAEESDLTPVLEAMAKSGLWIDSFDRRVYQNDPDEARTASEFEPLAIPVSGKFARGFGYVDSPVDNTKIFHSGIDIQTEPGTPVRATLDGQVMRVGTDQILGRVVEIDHAGQLTTVYGNLREILVEKGQMIKQGEIIGKTGGQLQGHGGNLHFEVRENGQPVDPLGKMATVRTSI